VALRRATLALAVLAACGALGACQFPRDPDDTLGRVEGGVLRVGATEARPWVDLSGPRPAGIEPALVESFARSVGARVAWTTGSEVELVGAMREGVLDLVVAGATTRSPLRREAAPTRPFAETEISLGLPPGVEEPREVLAEAGREEGGLAREELDVPVRSVATLAEARGRPAVAEDFLLDDLGLREDRRLRRERHVMLAAKGENAFLVALERHLERERASGRIADLLRRAEP